MAQLGKSPLRRSFSEHIKDSTNKAWDIFWKSAREKRLSEIEAKEACDWLKAAGFPQYAQLFEDSKFPVDIDLVKNDHEFLDRDAIDSLCRRLNTLNKCVEMKLEISRPRKRSEDSEDEEPCAISSKWAFERHSKRWSRLEGFEFPFAGEQLSALLPDSPQLKKAESQDTSFSDSCEKHDICSLHSSSSTESDSNSGPKTADDLETSRSSSRCSWGKPASPDSAFCGPPSPGEVPSFHNDEKPLEKPPRKKGKSLLRKMEKLRVRGATLKGPSPRKAKLLISGPVLQEGFDEDRLKRLNCVDIAELQEESRSSCSFSPASCSGSSQSESSSAVSTPSPVTRVRSHSRRARPPHGEHLSDINEQDYKNEKNRQENLIFNIPQGHKPGTFPKALSKDILSPLDNNTSVNWRTGSFHGCRGRRSGNGSSKDHESACSPLAAFDQRISIYDNVPGMQAHLRNTGETEGIGDDDVFSEMNNDVDFQDLFSKWAEKMSEDGDSDFANDSNSPCPSSPKEIHLEIKKQGEADPVTSEPEAEIENSNKIPNNLESTDIHYMMDSGVGSSLTHQNRQQRLHWSSEQNLRPDSIYARIESQSVSQLNLLQKLALLKLTALMDKYSPSSKQGWNWTVPKFIKKIKAPDYKDRRVFGVPLLLNVQRTGDPLPRSILNAMHYLRSQCLDQVGLFRKSGVKSRIQALREMNESDPESVSYEGQSAFDVADMLKQYFRDLPEPIFSSKLCESFLHIYQYFPKDQHFDAVQAAILLLPDENREALQGLLCFLRDVVACVEENQMTPTNLAVCLAPSLFHLNTLKRDSTTPRSSHRKYSLGRPDQKDLSENLAATQGLAHMVAESSRLFQVPKYWLVQHQSSSKDDITQSEGGQSPAQNSSDKDLDKQAHLDVSVQVMLKEARERFKGWVACSSSDSVDLAFRKVNDGNPLRFWRGTVEVEATQEEVFHRILREQRLWEKDFQHTKIIETLGNDAEICHYIAQSMGPQPPREYVLLRTWQCDPQTGTFVLAAVSTEHPDVTCEGVRAEVLMCLYLIDAIGLRKSRLTHVCRTDSRGRTPEWYNKVSGHLLAADLVRIRDSFKPDMKETKI
ncbi:rho GTPase-activating protein 7 isoform X1 [Lepisosteus oculatus]|uniref:rho GTPase-activating protein 7 isoform X1 n=1 Tax=Lepisosteus oculatus TaxID=7918 RepID=UPI0035F51E28